LVDEIRRNCRDIVSLVAVSEKEVVGHILFSPVTIPAPDRQVTGMGLAPMAVVPGYQRRGIGSDLVRAGMESLERGGCPFVLVLGHAEYYPRFGFVPGSRHGIRSEWEVPDEAFMIRVLNAQAMEGVSGVAQYRPEFASAL